MEAKEIENILKESGRLLLRDYPFGERFFVENNDGCVFQINKSQFYKFKETCLNKDEFPLMLLRGMTKTYYFWR